MLTALYIIWFGIPVIFFLMALWIMLEKLSGKQRRERSISYLSQGIFVLVCSLISFVIERYFLMGVVEAVFGDLIPYGFFQVILLPVILYIAAMIIGPSKAIVIGKAPRPTQRWRQGNRPEGH